MRSPGFADIFRRLGILAIIAAGALLAANSTATATAPIKGYQDCFKPATGEDYLVTSVRNTDTYRTINLRCGRHDVGDKAGFGLRHINDRRPPITTATVQCIEHVLRSAKYEGPASGNNNVSYTISSPNIDAVVIVNAETDNVVTAYTSQPGSSASNNWEGCLGIPAAAQHTPNLAKSGSTPYSGDSCWLGPLGFRSVCENVHGEKLHVDTLDASEGLPPWADSSCATPVLYANGRMFRLGFYTCSELGTLKQHFAMNNDFPNNLQLCLGWTDIDHQACLTVHD
ncbi:hypothetical protein ACWEHA_27605 [Amycolatopsis nivea]